MSHVMIDIGTQDRRAGWRRLSQDLGPDFEDAAREQLEDLCRLWERFIEHTSGVYTVEAFYVMWFAHGHGTERQWQEWSREFLENGIEACLKAYFAGVPVDDVMPPRRQ